jgi:hypothetical protein
VDGSPEAPSDASVVRTLRLLVIAVCAVLVGTVVVLLTRGRDVADDTSPTTVAEGDAVAAIGPESGVALGPYVDERRAALATATGDRVAVVSLVDYRSVDAADEILDGLEGVRLMARLVAARGGEPSVVAGALGQWAEAARREARDMRVELEGILPTVEAGSEFIAFYASEIERLKVLEQSISATGEVVFALVVRAPVATLRRIADQGDVRLVDIGPSDRAVPDADYRGLRPEEQVAGEPPFRPSIGS